MGSLINSWGKVNITCLLTILAPFIFVRISIAQVKYDDLKLAHQVPLQMILDWAGQ